MEDTTKSRRNTMLLCTFVNSKKFVIAKTISSIIDIFGIKKEIFQFKTTDPTKIVLTYNVDNSQDYDFPKNTLQIHRNKNTNTLYSLNALNKLIADGAAAEGKDPKDFRINWDNYKDSLIIMQKQDRDSNNKVLAVLKLELDTVISPKVA
jgi:hypothetical protein